MPKIPTASARGPARLRLEVRVGRRLVDPSLPTTAAALRAELESRAMRAARLIADEAQRLAPVAFGRFRRSIRPSVERRGDVVQPRVTAGVHYAGYVEHGRRAGRQPPVAALVPWVKRKLGVPAKRARSVAFLVARKIGRRGIRAKDVVARAARSRSGAVRALYRGGIVAWRRRVF